MGHVKWYGNEGAVRICGMGGLQAQVGQQPEQSRAGSAVCCGAACTDAPGLPAPCACTAALCPVLCRHRWGSSLPDALCS